MATEPNPVLSEMINDAPEQAAAADQSLTQIEDTQEKLGEESTAIEENVCDVAAADLRTYLEGPKLAEIQALYPAGIGWAPVYLVIHEPPYGVIDYTTGNITAWEFLQDDIPFTASTVRYVYNSTSDPTITQWVDDFAFGNDYITHPLGNDAAYGLNPLIDSYGDAKSVVSAGKAKVEASVDILTRYNDAS